MSQTHNFTTPPTGSPTFVFVVDGEVVDMMVIAQNEMTERRIAVLSSDPKVYVLEGGFPESGATPDMGTPWPIQ